MEVDVRADGIVDEEAGLLPSQMQRRGSGTQIDWLRRGYLMTLERALLDLQICWDTRLRVVRTERNEVEMFEIQNYFFDNTHLEFVLGGKVKVWQADLPMFPATPFGGEMADGEEDDGWYANRGPSDGVFSFSTICDALAIDLKRARGALRGYEARRVGGSNERIDFANVTQGVLNEPGMFGTLDPDSVGRDRDDTCDRGDESPAVRLEGAVGADAPMARPVAHPLVRAGADERAAHPARRLSASFHRANRRGQEMLFAQKPKQPEGGANSGSLRVPLPFVAREAVRAEELAIEARKFNHRGE